MAENLGMDIHVTAKGAKQVAVDLDAVTRAAENAEKAANKGKATWQQQAEAFHRNEQAVKKNTEAQKKAAEEADKMRKSMSDLLAQIDPMEKKLQELDRLEQELAKAYKLGAIEADKYSDAIKKINADRKDAVTGNKSYAQSLQEIVGALGLATAAAKGFSFLSDVTQTAARYEQLGVLMQTLGATAGYTARELEAVESSLVDMGISMIQSRDVVQSMISASMDLADATKLARLAQDAATIGGINSSEALERMIQGIQTANTQVLRNIGIVVSFEDAYTKMAASIGKNTSQLTEAEKQQARVNEVLAQAPALAGAYENSMQTAAKQAGSMERHLLNLKTRMGEVFQPLYASSIKAQSDALEAAAKNADLVSYAIAGVVAGVTALTAGIATATVGVTTFKAALDLLTRHPVILALSALSSLLAVGYLAWSDNSKEAMGYKGSLDILNGSVEDVTKSMKELNAVQQEALSISIAKKIEEEAEKMRAAREEMEAAFLSSAVASAGAYTFGGGALIDDAQNQTLDLIALFHDGQIAVDDFISALREGMARGDIPKELYEEIITLSSTMLQAGQESERLEKIQAALQAAIQNTADAARDAAGGVATFDSAMADALKAGESYLKSLSERATVAGLDTEVAILKAREAAGQIAFADDEARQAALAHAKTLDDVRAARESANKGSRTYANSLKQEEQAYKALVKAAMPYEAAVAQLEEHITTLNKALKKGEVTQSQYAATIASLEDSYKKAVIATIPHVKAIDDEVKSTENAVRSMRQRVDTFGMTASAIARAALAETSARIATLETIKATQQATGASSQYIEQLELEIDALKRLEIQQEHLAGLASTNERQEAEKRHYDDLAAEAKRTHDEIERSLTDALMRGFEAGEGFGKNFINTLKNMFASLVLRPIIQPIAQSAAGAVTSALGIGGGQSGIGSLLGGVSNINSLVGAFSGSLVSSLGSGIASLGSTFGSSALSSFAAGMKGSTLAAGLAGPTTAGAGGAMGAGAMAGAALPWVAGGLAAYSLISSLTNKGETRHGGGFVYDPNSRQAMYHSGPSGGYGGQQTLSAVESLFSSAADTIVRVFEGAGVDAGLALFHGAFESSSKGRGGTFSGGDIVLADGSVIGFGGAKKGDGFGGTSGSTEEMFANLQKEVYFSTLEAWQTVSSEFPSVIGDMLSGIDVRALGAEQAAETVAQIQAMVEAVNLFSSGLKNLPIENLNGLSFDAAAGLLELMGGLDGAANQISSFYENFYTEVERSQHTVDMLNREFGRLNIEVPESREAFRELVNGIDLATEDGRELYAELIGLSGAFASVVDWAEEAVDATLDLTSAIETLSGTALSHLTDSLYESLELFVLAAGGVDEFNRSFGVFYQAFYSAAELGAIASENFLAAMSDLGQEVPLTAEGFRDLVNSIQVVDEESAQLRASLMALSGDASQFYNLINEAARAAEKERNDFYSEQKKSANDAYREQARTINDAHREQLKAINANYSAQVKAARDNASKQAEIVRSQYDRQRKALTESIGLTNDRLRDLRSLESALLSGVKTLTSANESASQMALSSAKVMIDSALGLGRAGKSLAGLDGLVDAVGLASNVDKGAFATLAEFELEQKAMLNKLDELSGYTGDQIGTQELMLTALEKQIDDLAVWRDRQIETIKSREEATLAALELSRDKQIEVAELSLQKQLQAADDALTKQLDHLDMLASQEAELANQRAEALVDSVLSGNSLLLDGMDLSSKNTRDLIWSIEDSSRAISRAVSNIRVTVNSVGSSESVPQFANGGIFIAGERGPEVVDISAARIHNASKTEKMLSNEETVERLEKVEETLEKYLPIVAASTKAFADIARRWNFDGMPEQRQMESM